MPSPLYTLDFGPVSNALDYYRQQSDKADRQSRYQNALGQVGGLVDQRMMPLLGAMDAEHGPNALFSVYNAAQARAQAQAQLAEQARHNTSLIDLERQRVALAKQQENRTAEMTPYDIAIKKADAANKQMDTDLMRGLVGGGQAQPAPSLPPPNALDPRSMPGQAPPLPPMRGPAPLPQQSAPRSPLPMPGEAPNMPAPRPPLAGPQVQPQSGDGFDPSMVRPIADMQPGQTPMAPPTPAPNTIKTPFGEMTPERAHQMAGLLALRGKGEAAKLIEKQIEQANLGKHTQDKIGEKALNTAELSARLDGIAAKFKPEYQTLDMQAKMYGVSWMDAIGPLRGKLAPELRKQFEEYTAYKQEATDNLSRYIQEITGAAVGVQEEKRIRAGMPDPEKDTPAQFEAKLANKVQQARYAQARYNYLISQGYDAKALSANKDKIEGMIKIEDMQQIMQQRGRTIKQEIVQQMPGLPDDRANDLTAMRVRKEFGI